MTKFYFEEDGQIVIIEEGHELFNDEQSFDIDDMDAILESGFWV